MLVWRVAHESARYEGFPSGPYACSDTLPEAVSTKLHLMFEAHCDIEHPSPYADADLRGISSHERCGFDSREALDEWFSGFARVLSECGFRVYTYDVPDFASRVGRAGQTVFDQYEAKELGSERLNLQPQQTALFA